MPSKLRRTVSDDGIRALVILENSKKTEMCDGFGNPSHVTARTLYLTHSRERIGRARPDDQSCNRNMRLFDGLEGGKDLA